MTDLLDAGNGLSGQTPALVAVVVTFQPGDGVEDNLRALAAEADRILVVDNGSRAAVVERLQALAGEWPRVEVLPQGENLGIAAALNVGVRRALALGASWVLLMDQDSRVLPGFGPAMVHAFETSPLGDRLAVLVPRYSHADHAAEIPQARAAAGGLEAALTSGSLQRAALFQQHGLFREELFIDGVDLEWSLRLRRAGLLLEQTEDATLVHGLGAPRVHAVGGRALQTVNYSPARRHYQERNKLWLIRHYGREFPAFTLRPLVMSAKDLAKVLLFEEQKAAKALAFLRGWRDGLLGRTGPLPGR